MAAAPIARGADRIYWSNLNGNSISYANLDGSGGRQLPIDPATLNGPMGLAIDSVTGKLYWANYGVLGGDGTGTSIGVANLDGTDAHLLSIAGVPVMGPHGVAIDPVSGKIYWTNHDTPSAKSWIGVANIDGSNASLLSTGAATVDGPRGLALDPAGGKIYWANWIANSISYANLDGSGGGNLATGSATVESPEGVALSPNQGRLYYGNFTFNPDPPHETISYLNLDGSGGADLPTPGATRDHPHGVAIDPTTNRIYWPNFDVGVISYENLDGSGGADLPTPGATKNGPNLPVLLKAPVAAGAPAIEGGFSPGSSLKCTQGAWSGDLLASLLYQSPESFSFRWREKDRKVARSRSKSITAHSLGEYRCRVTARNDAGSAPQTSGWYGVFEVARPKLDLGEGTATLEVTVPGPGKVSLSGKGVVKQPRTIRWAREAGSPARKVKTRTVKLVVKARGKAKRHLQRTGVARVKVKVTFTPAGGAPSPQLKTVKLKKARAGRRGR